MSDAKPSKQDKQAAALEAARLAREAKIANYTAVVEAERRPVALAPADPVSAAPAEAENSPASAAPAASESANPSEASETPPAAQNPPEQAPAVPVEGWKGTPAAKKSPKAAKPAPPEPEAVPTPWEKANPLIPVGFNTKFKQDKHAQLAWLVQNLPNTSLQKIVHQAVDTEIARLMELPLIKAAMKEQFNR
jgi:hypothetical protein